MRLTVSLLMLPLLSGCIPGAVTRHLPLYVSNVPFYPDHSVGPIPKYPNTKIAYVELDDMGDLWNDVQIKKAEEMIRDANSLALAAKPEKTGAIVLTYVHGWHQSADPKKTTDTRNPSNLEMFQRILGWTAYDETRLLQNFRRRWNQAASSSLAR